MPRIDKTDLWPGKPPYYISEYGIRTNAPNASTTGHCVYTDRMLEYPIARVFFEEGVPFEERMARVTQMAIDMCYVRWGGGG